MYMVIVTRLLYANDWKGNEIPTVEDWMIKLIELTEMAKLTSLVRGKTIRTFLTDWKPYMEFLLKEEKSELIISGSGDLKGTKRLWKRSK